MPDSQTGGIVDPEPAQEFAYLQEDNPAFEAEMARRSVLQEGAFFLPHLRPGMRLLDLGCGPGSISVGFAEVLSPGEVVGVDAQPGQVERARKLAGERNVTNATFEVADAHQLPFPDNSFDAAFAHVVLMHLREPVRALTEVGRVLRTGGVVGLRDPDFGSSLRAPMTPLLEEHRKLIHRVLEHNGADPFRGRRHRRLLLDAGFVRTESSATAIASGSPAACRANADFMKAQFAGISKTALAQGWVDQPTLDAMSAEIDAWAEQPDAFNATTFCETIGWCDG